MITNSLDLPNLHSVYSALVLPNLKHLVFLALLSTTLIDG